MVKTLWTYSNRTSQLTFRIDVAFRDVTVNKGAEDVED